MHRYQTHIITIIKKRTPPTSSHSDQPIGIQLNTIYVFLSTFPLVHLLAHIIFHITNAIYHFHSKWYLIWLINTANDIWINEIYICYWLIRFFLVRIAFELVFVCVCEYFTLHASIFNIWSLVSIWLVNTTLIYFVICAACSTYNA
jgi:hypothetical protein